MEADNDIFRKNEKKPLDEILAALNILKIKKEIGGHYTDYL